MIAVRYGARDSAGEVTDIAGLAISSRGIVAIGDYEARAIRIYASDGQYLRTIGQKGSGPGEFQRVSALGLYHDTLWVFDDDLRRATFFLLTGRRIRTYPMPFSRSGDDFLTPIAYFGGRWLARGFLTADEIARGKRSTVLAVVDTTATVIQTLQRIATSEFTYVRRAPNGRGVGLFSNSRATVRLEGDPIVIPLSDEGRVVVVNRSAYDGQGKANIEIAAYDIGHATPTRTLMSYVPLALRKSLTDSIVETLASSLVRAFRYPSVGAAVDSLHRQFKFPNYYPPVSAAAGGGGGSLWLRQPVGSMIVDVEVPTNRNEHVPWIQVDRKGSLLQRVAVPAAIRVFAGDGASLWGVYTDNDGFPWVVKLLITQP
jgi:hypothetical protein